MPSYFLALLPELDLPFYKQVEEFFQLGFYFDVRLPFHVTVYYFMQLNDSDLNAISAWMDHTAQAIHSFTANVQGVGSFTRPESQEMLNVYYLKVEAAEFIQINNDLRTKFASIIPEEFTYVPHLSLLFPRNLSASNKISKRLNDSFDFVKQLNFTHLALFASQDGAYTLVKKVKL